MNNTAKTIVGICVFSIAMAALEGAVVVYLRALYYPNEFTVTFQVIEENIMKTELLRELATLVMLVSVGYISGKTFNQRMAYSLLAFGIWDIFYYGWLKVLIDWPSSLFEWDILFLIPVAWLGPVWAPVLCSITMMLLAAVLLKHERPISTFTWSMLYGGSILILYTFMEDYGGLIITHGFLGDFPDLLGNDDFLQLASAYVPAAYSWHIFWLGQMLLLAGIYAHHRGTHELKQIFSGFRGSTRHEA